jgi:hypothetical protein
MILESIERRLRIHPTDWSKSCVENGIICSCWCPFPIAHLAVPYVWFVLRQTLSGIFWPCQLHSDSASDLFFILDRSDDNVLNIRQLAWLDSYWIWIIGYYPSCARVFLGSTCGWIQSERQNEIEKRNKSHEKPKANKAQILRALHTWPRIH